MTYETPFTAWVSLDIHSSHPEERRLHCEPITPYGHLVQSGRFDFLLQFSRSPYSSQSAPGGLIDRTRCLAVEYQTQGPVCFQRIDDPFMVVAWERADGRLTLARDPGGRSCLYYTIKDGCVVASNSLPHLLEKAGLPSRLSADALDLYLGFGFIPAPYCIIEGVHKVAPGTTVTIDGGGSRTDSFLPLPEAPHDEARAPESSPDQLEERLAHSLGRVTEGEDRIRLLLSGGIDSSLLAWLVTRIGRPDITTVCIDTGTDDSITRAQQVAGQLRIQHETIPPPPFSFDRLMKILEHLDEPIADSMIYPLTHLMEELAGSTHLCITGIGSDSLFGGLNTHLALALWADGGELPMAARERLGARPAATVIHELELLRSAPDPFIGWTRIFTLLSAEERLSLIGAHRSREQIGKTLPDFVRDWFGPVKRFADRAMRFDAEVPMADSTLQVVRQAARFAGVTYDTPFLTSGLFGFSRRLPRRVLIQDSEGKIPLKRLLQQRLPSGPWQLPKIGFRLPLDRILEIHRPTVEEILHSDKGGLLNPSLVRRWLHEFYSRQPRDFPLARKIWSIVMWELWCQTHSVRGPTGL